MSSSPFASLWALDPSVAYLNHGSFGACPIVVLEHQSELRRRMEREPVDFFVRDLPALRDAARRALAAFVGAEPADLVFVANATAGVNAVVRSLELAPGDELLTTSHAYAACRKTLQFAAARSGAMVVVAPAPFPVASEDELVAPILEAVSPRTRLALVDQVASPTAVVFPVARIVRELAARGVETIVDGAHALGAVEMRLDAAGAAYTVGNAHKWLCAPKGSAFLHVRRDRHAGLHPTVISHGYEPGAERSEEDRFAAEFDWTGTADPTAYLSIPAVLEHLGAALPGGWTESMARNRALALRARERVGAALGVATPCPESMVGTMASIPLPRAAADAPVTRLDAAGLAAWCRARGVESWFYPWPAPGGKLVRLSAQLYNHDDQYDALVPLLREALGV